MKVDREDWNEMRDTTWERWARSTFTLHISCRRLPWLHASSLSTPRRGLRPEAEGRRVTLRETADMTSEQSRRHVKRGETNLRPDNL